MAGVGERLHRGVPGYPLVLPRDSALVVTEYDADPSLLTDVWQSLAHDQDFPDLSHYALVFNSSHNAGYNEAAIARFDGFTEGIAFVVQAIRHAQHREGTPVSPNTNAP